ncbi:MAG: hypothetical protein JWM34_924 [Ilumatobacteraceae bacterium]|nr:hypothetical protein [Ilumatobacteraceae bacterium]
MIADPPSLAGADHDSTTELLAGWPVPPVGAPGTVITWGVMKSECAEIGPVPATFFAATSNSRAVPLLRPVTVNEVAALLVDTGVCATALMNGVIE